MRSNRSRGRGYAIFVALVALGALVGCREDEQDRIMLYEPGVYQGQPDSPLAPEQVGELRSRAQRQQY